MADHEFNIGDKIRVIGYRPAVYPPGIEDEMGTEALFQSMVGRRYTIRGFDEFGCIELRPNRYHAVWIEACLVEAVRSRGSGDEAR